LVKFEVKIMAMIPQETLDAMIVAQLPMRVADRNANVIPTAQAIPGDAPYAPPGSLVIQNSDSKSVSSQLDTAGLTVQPSDGIAAASTGPVPIVPASDVFAPHDVFPTGAATPVDPGTLQTTSANNGFATISAVPSDTVIPMNQLGTGSDKFDRVKLRYKSGHPMASYPGALNPLARTTGLVWLFKPAIQVTMPVDYESVALTHSIQEIHAFSSNKAPTISVSGQFVSQNIDEATYALAAIHFMRSVAKMSFGTEVFVNGQVAGTPIGSPPPVLLLSGYGLLMFNDIPVIVTNVSLDLPADVDYIQVPYGPGNGTKIPVSFNLTANLVVQQSPANMRNFALDSYVTSGQKGWW
jgi:hypothetical protein